LKDTIILDWLRNSPLFLCIAGFYSVLYSLTYALPLSKFTVTSLMSFGSNILLLGLILLICVFNLLEVFAKPGILSWFKASPPAGGWNRSEAVQKGT